MSDTPRTDAEPTYKTGIAQTRTVNIDFARQLERELAEAQAEITRLKGEAESWEKVFDRTCEHLAGANARLDWLDTVECGIQHRSYGEYWHYIGKGFPKAREVIDAAMKEGGK
jgi:hypothetical protein